MALEITDATFDSLVLQSDKPVLVVFGQHGVVLAAWLDLSLMN